MKEGIEKTETMKKERKNIDNLIMNYVEKLLKQKKNGGVSNAMNWRNGPRKGDLTWYMLKWQS